MSTPPRYQLVLTPLPRPLSRDPRGIRRLRALLKAAARQYGLRALSIVECQDGRQNTIDPEEHSE